MSTDNLALRPNCLLTKYPIVFITGIRSLFFYEKLGGRLQDYISAHGYQVLSPAMPFRSENRRKSHFIHWLKNQRHKRFHFILSQRTHNEFRDVLKDYYDSSFSVISENFKSKTQPTLAYQLHQLFCRLGGTTSDAFSETLPDQNLEFYDRFLDHCVELAENDLI